MISRSIKENCISSINEFFECEELIYGSPWDNESKNYFINDQLEKRIFLYQFLENKLFKKKK